MGHAPGAGNAGQGMPPHHTCLPSLSTLQTPRTNPALQRLRKVLSFLCRAEQHRDLSLSTLSSALVLPKGCHEMEHPPRLQGGSCPADTELINTPIPQQPQQPIFGTNTAISSQQRGASG